MKNDRLHDVIKSKSVHNVRVTCRRQNTSRSFVIYQIKRWNIDGEICNELKFICHFNVLVDASETSYVIRVHRRAKDEYIH